MNADGIFEVDLISLCFRKGLNNLPIKNIFECFCVDGL